MAGLGDRSHARFPDAQHLKTPANITRCDRQIVERLKQLNKDVLKKEIGEFVTDYQINGLLARRDKIVEIFEKAGPGRGLRPARLLTGGAG